MDLTSQRSCDAARGGLGLREVLHLPLLTYLLSGCTTLVVPLGGDKAGTGGDGGFACSYDIDCAPWHGLCADSGACIELPPTGGRGTAEASNTCDPDGGAQPCEQFATGSGFTYCTDPGTATNRCYCHPDPYFDQGGVCYRAAPECGPCKSSMDCGANETDLNDGNGSTCLPVADAGAFCLFTYFGRRCDRAYGQAVIDGGALVCYPFCNTCPCAPCYTAADCPAVATGVCATSGACIPPCQVAANCPPNEVCHVLGRYLDPSLGPFYGAGECGPPCSSSSACAMYQGGGTGSVLTCLPDHRYPDGGPPLDDAGVRARCRVDGCMNTDECVEADTDAGGTIWCDVWGGNQCVSDYCQLGTTANEQNSSRTQCQIGYCCMGDAGVARQDDAGPAHGVCATAPLCQMDATLDCCDPPGGS